MHVNLHKLCQKGSALACCWELHIAVVETQKHRAACSDYISIRCPLPSAHQSSPRCPGRTPHSHSLLRTLSTVFTRKSLANFQITKTIPWPRSSQLIFSQANLSNNGNTLLSLYGYTGAYSKVFKEWTVYYLGIDTLVVKLWRKTTKMIKTEVKMVGDRKGDVFELAQRTTNVLLILDGRYMVIHSIIIFKQYIYCF